MKINIIGWKRGQKEIFGKFDHNLICNLSNGWILKINDNKCYFNNQILCSHQDHTQLLDLIIPSLIWWMKENGWKILSY